jgi:hypothetical protein
MKKGKVILIIALSGILFYSCQSSKRVQREMQNFRSELDYELTTPEYLGEIEKTVYLNPIDNSNLEYQTSAKKNGTLFLPFLLYYHSREKFNITLGEHSLIQPYREFLMDALLAECNRSTCFNLEETTGDITPESAFVLDVKISQNKTTSGIVINNSLILLPFDNVTFNFYFSNHKVNSTVSDLEINVRLTQQKTCLFEKTYFTNYKLPDNKKRMDNSSYAYEVCTNNLVECLSITTKQVVEEISRDLHLMMLAK